MPVTAGSSVHSFRFEAIYDCGVSHLLSISREFDLMASWNRFVLNPCVLQEPTLFSSLLVSPSLRDGSILAHGSTFAMLYVSACDNRTDLACLVGLRSSSVDSSALVTFSIVYRV